MLAMYTEYLFCDILLDGRYQNGRFLELLNYALNPANDFVMEELFNAGFESGEVLSFLGALQKQLIYRVAHINIDFVTLYNCLILSEYIFTRIV